MGCGQSKNQIGVVASVKQTSDLVHGETKKTISRTSSRKINVKQGEQIDNTKHSSDPEDDQHVPPPKDSRKKRMLKQNTWAGSQDSLYGLSEGGTESRGGSATSKASHHSTDSGFADNEYNKVITENSDPNVVRTVEEGFETPRELDMGVVGRQCPQRYSAKDKERMEEQRILASLREEGLITRPMSRATGGLAFEVTEDMNKCANRLVAKALPPIKLAKLEKRKKRRRKITEEDIKAKLDLAEQRRKEVELQRLEKIQAVTQKSNVQTALDSFAQLQKYKEEETTSKVDQAAENREKRLKEMRDKLRAKQEHAEKVRRRKQLVPLETDDLPPMGAPRSFSEDTPIVTKSSMDFN